MDVKIKTGVVKAGIIRRHPVTTRDNDKGRVLPFITYNPLPQRGQTALYLPEPWTWC
jgi:hypothetical protein